MIQSSPVFRLLKEQGYHVTVNTTTMGQDVLRHNPNVDEVALQLHDIVPNNQLGPYVESLKKRFDLVVNLSGSAEESMLFPDRILNNVMEELRQKNPDTTEAQRMDATLKQFRKKVAGKNYYDNHLEKAGLPERGLNGELYFSPDEENVAHQFREFHKNDFLIEWSLSGSAYHKIYPYFQQAVAMLLHPESKWYIPEALVVSVGDYICSMMERSESERYYPRAEGSNANVAWPLRLSMIMTKYSDLVVGTETGILNAAGCFDTPKITLLSHSSHGNLCKYWKNDFCLAPENTFCHPCHTLHYHHPRGKGTFCKICNETHYPEMETAIEMGWTCPAEVEYTDAPKPMNIFKPTDEEGQPYPMCCTRGYLPDRLCARIHEVYALWKAKRDAKELTAVVT